MAVDDRQLQRIHTRFTVLARTAADVARCREDALMCEGALPEVRCAELTRELERLIGGALGTGASLDDLWEVLHPAAGHLAFRLGRAQVAEAAAALAFITDAGIVSAEGESPAAVAARRRRVLASASGHFDAALRSAVAGGLSLGDIIEVAASEGVDLAPVDVTLAFRGITRA